MPLTRGVGRDAGRALSLRRLSSIVQGHTRLFGRSISLEKQPAERDSGAPISEGPVYNDRLLKRSLTFLVCAAFAAAPRVSAAQTAGTEDAPVPGGVVEFARAVGIRPPAPDRGRFLYDVTRILYGTDNHPPIVPAVLQTLGRHSADRFAPIGDGDGTTESPDLVSVPLTAEIWSNAVFHRKVTRDDLVAAIVSDRQASLLCHGLLALDDETLRFFADHGALLTRIVERSAPAFAAFSSSLHVSGGRVVPPGAESRGENDDISPMWEAVLAEKVSRPDRFIQLLFEANEGRVAYLYDTIGQIDPARRAFALGLWMPGAAARAERFRALATDGVGAFREWHLRSLPFGRAGFDLGMVLSRVAVEEDGRPAEPAARGFWTRAFAGRDVFEDPRQLQISDEEPIDAAWLTAAVGGADVRARGERLDQLAFATRVFREAGRSGRPERFDALIAVRGFPRYRMLMLTLERVGLREPAVFASAARQAARIGTTDGHRAFVALGQYQGALALVARAVRVRTLDAARGRALITQLIAIPLGDDGRFNGGIARWIRDDFLSEISGPAGTDLEHRVIAAMAGPAWSDPRDAHPIVWEGQRYHLDLGAAERLRLNTVRERQLALPFDVAMTIAEAGRALAVESTPLVRSSEIVAHLTQILAEVRKRSREEEADAAPPGAGMSRDQHDTLQKSIDEIAKAIRGRDARRVAKLAEPVIDLGDDM